MCVKYLLEMEKNVEIKIVKNLGTFNTNNAKESFDFVMTSNSNAEYTIYFIVNQQIVCNKLVVNNYNLKTENEDHKAIENLYDENVTFQIVKVFHLPIQTVNLMTSNKELWVFGKEYFLKLYLKNFLPDENVMQNSEKREIPMDEDFHISEFEYIVEKSKLHKHNFHHTLYCLNCDLCPNSFIISYIDENIHKWRVVMVTSSSNTSSDLNYIPLFSFPLSSCESDKINSQKPKILFSSSSDTIWHKVFETEQQLISNYVCLIGYPDGEIIYSLCSYTNTYGQFELITEFQHLYYMKQPILSINFIKNFDTIKECLLFVEKNGKLVFITSEKYNKEAESISFINGTLWVIDYQLVYSIKNQLIMDDCLIHLTNKENIWVTKFSSNENDKLDGKNCLVVKTFPMDFSAVSNIVLLDKVKGLFLMLTNTNNIYLMQYSMERSEMSYCKSLPYLMNGVLQQSIRVKDLLSIKHLQAKLFSAISTFATLKFKDGNQIHMDCFMTEVEDSKRMLININFKEFGNLNFDSDFWLISASVFNYFEEESALISKTKPFIPGQIFSIDLMESNICTVGESPFPLYLEVGLILHLPERLSTLDCFKPLIKRFPLYVRTNTLILNELYLLKNKSSSEKYQNFPNDNSSKSTVVKIAETNREDPIYKLLDKSSKQPLDFCNENTFCLLNSTAQCIFKCDHKDADILQCVGQLLGKKSFLLEIDETIMCRNHPISISVTQTKNAISITLSSQSVVLLHGLRIAITELILNMQNKPVIDSSNSVSIPTGIHRKCEDLSKELCNLFEVDVTKPEYLADVLKLYDIIRKEVSEKLPF